jgi:hypothetical protein
VIGTGACRFLLKVKGCPIDFLLPVAYSAGLNTAAQVPVPAVGHAMVQQAQGLPHYVVTAGVLGDVDVCGITWWSCHVVNGVRGSCDLLLVMLLRRGCGLWWAEPWV